MQVSKKIVKDRGGQIGLLRKHSAKMKSKTNLITLILCICLTGGMICVLHYVLFNYILEVGGNTCQILVVSQGVVTIFLIAAGLGVIIAHFLSVITVKYSKDDLLLDACERIEGLEKEIIDLKRHNKAAQNGQPGQSGSENSGEAEH